MWGTLPKVFDRTCTYYADRTALVDADRRLSYAQMRQWANRVGNGLTGLGVGNGHRVGLLMPNCLEFIPTMCGIWKAGAAVTQMPTRASAEDFHYFLDEVGASTLIYHESFDGQITQIRDRLPELRHVIRLGGGTPAADVLDYETAFATQPSTAPDVDISVDDLAFVGFTSGTTGVPKGVL